MPQTLATPARSPLASSTTENETAVSVATFTANGDPLEMSIGRHGRVSPRLAVTTSSCSSVWRMGTSASCLARRPTSPLVITSRLYRMSGAAANALSRPQRNLEPGASADPHAPEEGVSEAPTHTSGGSMHISKRLASVVAGVAIIASSALVAAPAQATSLGNRPLAALPPANDKFDNNPNDFDIVTHAVYAVLAAKPDSKVGV